MTENHTVAFVACILVSLAMYMYDDPMKGGCQ